MTTEPIGAPARTTPHPYRCVVLDPRGAVKRTLYRSQHYAAVLSFLSRNIDARPNLDIMKGDRFVAWELEPALIEPGVVIPAGVKASS